jgi:phage terminase small subunit
VATWTDKERQMRFVEEYLIDLNATQAAIRAGYTDKTKSAAELAHRLMEKEYVREAIAMGMAERSRRTGINQDRVVRELARIAFVNVTDLINVKNATVKSNATADDTAVIQSVKVKDGKDFSEREVKLADKVKALELLGRHLGMWNDKLTINAPPVEFAGADRLED